MPKIGCYAANSTKLGRSTLLFYLAVAANGDSVTIWEKPSEQGLLGGAEGQDAGILDCMDMVVDCMIKVI
jgi:hypothetical protein